MPPSAMADGGGQARARTGGQSAPAPLWETPAEWVPACAGTTTRRGNDSEASVSGTPIKAVLWDFGGVMTTGPFVNFARYERDNGLPKDFLRQVNSTNPDDNAWAQFERSDIDFATFDARFAEESETLGHRVPGADIIPLLKGDLRPEMIAALQRIKQQHKCACITNNVRDSDPDKSRGGMMSSAGRSAVKD